MKFGKTMQSKILICTSILSAVSFIVMTIIICMIVGKDTKAMSKNTAYATVSEGVSTLEGWLTNKQSLIEFMGRDVIVGDYADDRDTCRAFLADCTTRDPDTYETYIGFAADKSIIFGSGYEPPADYDPTSRGWYKAAVASSEPIITAPYTDVQTNRQVITCAVRVEQNGEIIGVLGADIYIDHLSEVVGEVKADENGYAVLLTDEGDIICHENEDFLAIVDDDGNDVMTSFADTVDDFARPDDGEFISLTDYDGQQVLYHEQTVDATGWRLGYLLNGKEFNESTQSLIITMLILAFVFDCIISISIAVIVKKMFAPMKDIADNSRLIAEGKLDVTFDYQYNDEIGSVCRAIENNNSVMKKYIEDIGHRLEAISHGDFSAGSNVQYIGDYAAIKVSLDKISKSLNAVFGGIENASASVFDGAGEVSSEASRLSESVTKQTELIDSIAAGMKNLSDKIDNNVSRTDSTRSTANKMAEAVSEGSGNMKQLLDAMNEISEASQKIQNIIGTIEDIAFQTNILALNASVEAARAGAAGKGFAVVADEVRNLAGKSAEASDSTNKLIERSVAAVNEGLKIAEKTSASLEEVVARTNEIDSIIVEINEESHEQKACVEDVSEKINHVSGYVNASAAGAEKSAAASEELNGQASALKNIIDDFRE